MIIMSSCGLRLYIYSLTGLPTMELGTFYPCMVMHGHEPLAMGMAKPHHNDSVMGLCAYGVGVLGV